MTAEDAKAYLAENDIPQLMESLITGLMYHRPDNPLSFLEACLEKAKTIGLDKVKWNSFLEETKKAAEGKESDNEAENEDNKANDEEKTDEEKSENDQKNDEEDKTDAEENLEEKHEDEETEDDKNDIEKPNEEKVDEDKTVSEESKDENREVETNDTQDKESEKEIPVKTHPQLIVLMGPPGSGKTIQLQKIADKYEDFVCFSVGNLLRNECEQNRGDDKWDAVNDSMNKGDLVDQTTVRRLLTHNMELNNSNYYVIDGIPRSVQQAEEIGRYIGRINIVFLLDCSEEYCKQQLLQNREIQSRGDDEDEAIEQRLLQFKEVTLPMLKRYDDMNLLHYINGEKDEDDVFEEICKIIDEVVPPTVDSSSPS